MFSSNLFYIQIFQFIYIIAKHELMNTFPMILLFILFILLIFLPTLSHQLVHTPFIVFDFIFINKGEIMYPRHFILGITCEFFNQDIEYLVVPKTRYREDFNCRFFRFIEIFYKTLKYVWRHLCKITWLWFADFLYNSI